MKQFSQKNRSFMVSNLAKEVIAFAEATSYKKNSIKLSITDTNLCIKSDHCRIQRVLYSMLESAIVSSKEYSVIKVEFSLRAKVLISDEENDDLGS